MKSVRLLLILGLGLAAGRPVLAQEAADWIGAADCRLAAVRPLPAQPPSWNGACKDGYAEGKGVLEWRSKSDKPYKLEASFAAGQVQGEGKLTLPSGAVYTGTLRHGMPEGHGYITYPTGSQYEGEVHQGQRDGVGEMLFANGDDYKGQWKHNKPDGTGVMTYELGGRYEGAWAEGRWSGQGKLVYAGTPERVVSTVDGRDPNRPEVVQSDKRYALQEDDAETGSVLKHRSIAYNLKVPPALDYERLSPEQRALVNDAYPALAPGDEPPYPLHGPAEYYRTLTAIGSSLHESGDVRTYLVIGKDGKALDVRVTGQISPKARKLVASAASMLQYKPARCAGEPCEMAYSYSLSLRTMPELMHMR